VSAIRPDTFKNPAAFVASAARITWGKFARSVFRLSAWRCTSVLGDTRPRRRRSYLVTCRLTRNLATGCERRRRRARQVVARTHLSGDERWPIGAPSLFFVERAPEGPLRVLTGLARDLPLLHSSHPGHSPSSRKSQQEGVSRSRARATAASLSGGRTVFVERVFPAGVVQSTGFSVCPRDSR